MAMDESSDTSVPTGTVGSADPRAVLFDLDGTLLDTLDDLADSVNAALSSLGMPEHAVDEYRYFVGDGIEILARRALPGHANDDQTVRACVSAVTREYGERWADKSRPYAGMVETLEELSSRRVVMAILSNKPDDLTRLTVERLLPHELFSIVQGARPDVPRKPHPAGALAISRELGLKPSEFLYLGDTDTDMKTAVAAGMRPVGATWGFRTASELTASGAEILLENPLDLLGLL
jgi:phosphoglycolate phosphatase